MNPASEYVKQSRDNSPVHRFVADNGQGISREEIEHRTIAGHRVAVSEELTHDEYALLEEAVEATEPVKKACFANTLRLWEYDDRFKYTEGYAVRTDLNSSGFAHAWCMLNGEKLVDITTPFDHYCGVIISDPAVVERYTGSNFTTSGIIGNHENRYEFLRKRGYYG